MADALFGRRRPKLRELAPRLRRCVRQLHIGMSPHLPRRISIATLKEVQRFFSLAEGSPVEAFAHLSPRYSRFELAPLDEWRWVAMDARYPAP
jgi:hypothetical protein